MYIIEREIERTALSSMSNGNQIKNNNVCLVLVVNKQTRGDNEREKDEKCDITRSAIKLYVSTKTKKKSLQVIFN